MFVCAQAKSWLSWHFLTTLYAANRLLTISLTEKPCDFWSRLLNHGNGEYPQACIVASLDALSSSFVHYDSYHDVHGAPDFFNSQADDESSAFAPNCMTAVNSRTVSLASLHWEGAGRPWICNHRRQRLCQRYIDKCVSCWSMACVPWKLSRLSCHWIYQQGGLWLHNLLIMHASLHVCFMSYL